MSEEYNHSRTVSDFEEQIEILRNHQYNPIAVSQLFCEDVFVFETDDEARRASAELEFNEDKSKNKLQAWWYGRQHFNEVVSKYESDLDCKVRIHWLKQLEA